MKNKITAYKAFDQNMQCLGFQYVEGKTHKHTGKVTPCESGFHSCENPVDIFQYYNPGTSVFHVVEAGGEIARHDGDSKIACSEIKIGASISLPDIIDASVKFMFERKHTNKTSKHSTGDSSASSATGDSSASSATGDSSASTCTGLDSKAMAGKYGCICLGWWNKKENRAEMRCAETGCGDGTDGKLKEKMWYVLDECGCFIEAGE